MARATRSKPAPKEATPEPSTSTTNALPPSANNPHKMFVLPKDTSEDSRIITLENPATSNPSRYYFCPEKGFHEFTRIAAPKKTPRTWLVTSENSIEDSEQAKTNNASAKVTEEAELGSGYVTKGADLFIATPIDLIFLILPALAPRTKKDEKSLFLSVEDHLDTLSASSRHLKVLLAQFPSLKAMMEKRMAACCDTVDAGDESMFRLSVDKLYRLLVEKAERMCKNGLPPSMEERFIKPALELPVMSIKREESNISTVSTSESAIQDDVPPSTEEASQSSTAFSGDSQSTTAAGSQSTVATSVITTEEPAPPPIATPAVVPSLLRLRSAINYLIHAYIPPNLHTLIRRLLETSTSPSFAPLDTHLAAISKLRAEAAALRSISDNISRKRGFEEDEDKIAEREEKKRKKEEEEKKKKTESRGIKQLKKADTSGMKKLSSFFTKAPKK